VLNENPWQLGGTQPSDQLMVSGTVYFTDPDSGQHHFVATGDPIFWSHNYASDPSLPLDPPLIGQWSFGILEPTANAPGEIHWTYFVSETQARSLAQGETETVVFQHTLFDDHGGQVAQNFQIDLFGSNEAPFLPQSDFTLFEYDQMVPYLLPPDELVRTQTQSFSIDEDPNVTGSGNVHQLNGAITFADPDKLDHPTVTFAFDDLRTGSEQFNALIPSLTSGFRYTIDSHDGNTGTIYWYYDLPDSALDFLAEGQSTHVTGSFIISEIGGSAMATLDFTLNGANDPVVIPGPTTTNVTYNVASHGTVSDSFVFNDPDWWPDGHSVEFVPHNPDHQISPNGLWVSQAGGFIYGGTGVESGAGGDEPVVWNYTIFDQSIMSGGGQHDVWDVIVRDSFGSTATHTLDFLLV
jgi:VCBS repeat-containing protein